MVHFLFFCVIDVFFPLEGFYLVSLIISVSTADIKMLAKATATFVPIAVP